MKIYKSKFTLIELIVSMGVFSILLLVTTTIFNTAQEAWTKSSAKSMAFKNVRVALDIMTSDIQSISSSYEGIATPFWYKPEYGTGDNANELINFISETIMPNPWNQNNLCEIKYQLFNHNNLLNVNSGWIMRAITDSSSTKWNFYDESTQSMNYNVGLSGANNAFTANSDSNKWPIKLIPYVTDLTFNCYDNNGTLIPGTINYVVELPFYIEIELKCLDKESWEKWVAIDSSHADGESNEAQNFRQRHERTFKKNVLIGNRGQDN